MVNTYNIYRFRISNLKKLIDKAISVGLIKQKEKDIDDYKMCFYFSKGLEGSPIWWWETYRQFFDEAVDEPKNKFYYGLLICIKNIKNPDFGFAITLGKSHFYVNKFIERNFGIELAIRIANEETILLKKSTYFSGSKKQEISSYKNFIKDSYEPGESVDHLKLKATDKDVWGAKNIIFADSIQMDIDKKPEELAHIFDKIILAMADTQSIRLPKREMVTDEELTLNLDCVLFDYLKRNDASLRLEEFQVYGVNFCFSFTEYNYKIATKIGRKHLLKEELGNSISIEAISKYVKAYPKIKSLNDLVITFDIEDKGSKFTRPLKEILDIYIQSGDVHYFLSNGDWCCFNQPFLSYLRDSLNNIDLKIQDPLDENDYLEWLSVKKDKIEKGEYVENKLTYREYYFNEKKSNEEGYELLDRELTLINSIENKKKKYKLEIADLYKDGEIISVKISAKDKELIYNIEQSKDALELILNGGVKSDKEIKYASLWFVFEQDIKRITEKNSIQFLLALQSWKKLVEHYSITPRIYFSKHINFKN
ncbi:DUF6119 family protein [Photorhabdus heterorhabditis]|uniref:Sporadically distributed protein, TIGR04141 family n=1 Tax=Photorhabdus heterorhabditis TaxID=880156 RepID=A0A5B0X8U0_9GAMM|nr:DUF6119 family protein [Photorhabdus heterorhabditis]KAA1194877.1 sporadically distributed protein, TIGR04141 family [Photorhabdus heterorhabditis]KOY62700.1 sporadically distributed protein, TIGR04141 family [Photorhabdus heterorhabditis]MBS9443690.1 sporadically distributed protein, TIGR04141 family [Photorhabdus heterorhabditis]